MGKPSYSPAKIARPRFKKYLKREMLFETLDEQRHYPCIWINGPAGSGKTTLISSYIEERRLTALWYQLDSGDQDIATFFHYLGLADQQPTSEKRNRLPAYAPQYEKAISIFSKRFFEALYGRMRTPAVLVLDNYHEVPTSGPFHDVVREALSAIPEGINLVILSRSGPPATLARARANNRLQTIGWSKLRLDQNETNQMLSLFGNQPYSEQVTRLIHEKVDGWPAGLLLLLQSSRHEEFQVLSLDDYTPEIIFDYFASEILTHTDVKHHRFLITTAIFPRMTAQMAAELTEMPCADQILSNLSRNNFFTDVRAGKPPTYEFHPLFREFLLAKGQRILSPARIIELKRAAASLLARDGQIEAAAALYGEAGDDQKLIQLILNHAATLLFQGRHQTLEKWIEILPVDAQRKEPWLLYWLGASVINTDPDGSRRFFEQAFSLFKTRNNAVGILSALCGMSDSIFQCFEQYDRFNELIPNLALYCNDLEAVCFPEIELQVTAAMLMALCARQPFHPDLKRWEARAFLSLEKDIPINAKIQLVISLIMYNVHAGDLAKTGHLLAMYREKADSGKVIPYALINLKILDAFYSWLGGYFRQCRTAYKIALELSSAIGNYNSLMFVSAHGLAGALSTGDLATADELFTRLEGQLDQFGHWEKRFFHILATWRALLENNISDAAFHSERSLMLAEKKEGKGLLQSVPVSHLGRAICLHAMGRSDEAGACLDTAVTLCERFKALQVAFGCHLARAQIALDAHDDGVAHGALEKAMRIGREKGYVNTYFWRPRVMSRLCARALRENIEPDYVRGLIRQRKLMPEQCSMEIEQWPWPVRIVAMNGFRIWVDDTPLQHTRKAQQVPLSLLKVLLALGGVDVPTDQVADALWPDSDGDAAHVSLATTLRRLRKLLNHPEAIRLRDKRLTIDPSVCWSDTRAFLHLVKRIKNIQRTKAQNGKAVEMAERAIAGYRGHFLGNEAWSAAIIAKREQLRHSFLKTVEWLGLQHESARNWNKAADCYEYGLQMEASTEWLYRRLMRCHRRLGRKAQALKTYDRCRHMMATEFDSRPSPETEALRQEILHTA